MLPKGGEGADAERNRPHEPDYPIITIHDCFACHAHFAPDLQRILLRGLRTMYEHFDPLNQFLKQVESTDTVPMPQVDGSEFEWENWAKNAFS